MLTHFTYQPFLSKESRQREYVVSFYHKGSHYKIIYHFNGEINWQDNCPAPEDLDDLTSSIHALMLFHVYDT